MSRKAKFTPEEKEQAVIDYLERNFCVHIPWKKFVKCIRLFTLRFMLFGICSFLIKS